ncbi:MAG: arginase family protein [Acidobacteria bacterium]|nr:arginase family protein [Acidobacteriota bacterium]MBV9069245.1 arginase family protein [Acidobacteriota bacterium]
MMRPLVLDFDGSVQELSDTDRFPLQHRQESIRFGCNMAALRALGQEIPAVPPIVFLGSGDYHHVSYLLIERLRVLQRSIQVVVFDNHPDNMRYPFGIHCGSWVWHVSRLPFVKCVHILGITSSDVEGWRVWENHLRALRSGRVRYWCIGRDLRALRRLGASGSQSFDSAGDLLNRFAAESSTWKEPVYLSIDKDVLQPAVVQTNWDQGVMTLEDLEQGIDTIGSLVVASDVTGDVSAYRYSSNWKRVLTWLDRQPEIPASLLNVWQKQHQAVNQRLFLKLGAAASAITEQIL